MPESIRSARPSARAFAATASALLAACSEGSDGPAPLPPPQAATIEVVSRNPPIGLAGEQLPDSVVVRVLDSRRRPVPDVQVSFAVPGGALISSGWVTTDRAGVAMAAWRLGREPATQYASIGVDGVPPVRLQARIADVPEVARPMLARLGVFIPQQAAELESIIPINPGTESFIRGKIALLRTPGLGSDVLEHRRWVLGGIASRSGATIPVVGVFATEPMRQEAAHYVDYIESAAPVLEDFFDMAFPAPAQGTVRMWYGFKTGMSGGGGTINVEDRASYNERTLGGRALPYDPGVIHELGHSFVGTESLTQFLEIYGYNVLQTGSADLSKWTYTRSWTPQRAENRDVHAVLDIYQLIGPEAMMAAFRAVQPLRPAYGVPLTAAQQQVFIDAAPQAVRAQVAAKIARVTF